LGRKSGFDDDLQSGGRDGSASLGEATLPKTDLRPSLEIPLHLVFYGVVKCSAFRHVVAA
jgi:hypothetical protein